MTTTHVLLVEDNPILCKVVCSALEGEDIRISEARAGAQALGLWGTEPPDLVLQDLMLPDMDGFDLVSRLRGLPGGAEIPILAMCGLLSELDQARISAVGFNDVIIKPLDVSKLRHLVRSHLPERGAPPVRFGGGRRVLVVDDDPRQAKLASFRLQRLGFEVCSASDGLEALRKARLQAPDAIVADIMMPLLDGFGLCAAIRKDTLLAGIPVVLMTNSYVDEADRELARAAGADEFVVRTPNLREVVEALRSSLRQRGGPAQRTSASSDELEKTWTRRIVRQLERQVAMNAGMAQRCALLSAELAVLGGISDALAQARDLPSALVDVLGACVDSGGFSLGALSLNGAMPQLLRFGAWDGWTDTEACSLVERAASTPQVLRGEPFLAASPEAVLALLPLPEHCRLERMAVVPVRRGPSCFGTLLMGSRTPALQPEDRLAFLESVASQIAQALALVHAFSEKEASERRANEQAAVLRSVVETVAEGVVVTDARGQPWLWNPSAEAILGKDGVRAAIQDWPERLGLVFAETLAPVAPAELPLVRALSGVSADEPKTYLLTAIASAPERYLTISARPLKEGERIAGAVAVLRDVTAEKATQTRLLVADRMASMGMLAAGVVHEINNPLSAVLGNLELANEALTTLSSDLQTRTTTASSVIESGARGGAGLADISGLLAEAADAATRVGRIVRDLRTLGRSEADVHSEIDVHAVLDVVLRMANNEVRHRARIVRDYGDVLPVLGNESRLCQVFLNLVINAAQALPDGRADENEIRIRTRMDLLGRVVVTVFDTGEGISPEAMRQLFVPFFTTKRVGMGTGLGLSICQRLVTAAGGEISVDSRRGQGSAFHVALPAAPGVSAAPAPAAAPEVHSAPRRGRLLLIDDEAMVLSVLSRALGKAHDCTIASSARDALALLRAGERYDLILCDLMMPVMNGMDLYIELADIAPDQIPKLLFLTGGAFTPELQSFLSSIDNEWREKPFNVAALLADIGTRIG